MKKFWFQLNEVAAGQKRLFLSYFIYKTFGAKPVYLIAFFISLFTFLFAKERRRNCLKYLSYLQNHTGQKFSKILGAYKIFLNYAISLVDKMISFSGGLCDDFEFKDGAEDEISSYIKENRGIIFLTTHIGNAEIMRSLLVSKDCPKPPMVNVFLEKKVCKIFNEFLEKIEKKINLETFALEDIGADTAILLDEKLKKGELVFIAGDRVAEYNTKRIYGADFLDKKINLPIGAIKLAEIMNSPIFFVVCVKNSNKYNIHIKKFDRKENKKETLESLKYEYSRFLEEYTIKYPLQFFHFYNLFNE